MQALLFILISAAALLAPAMAGDLPSRPFAELDRTDRETLVRHWLVDRFDAAAPIALDEAERQKLSRRYAEVLRRIAAGNSLSAAGYRQLLNEIAAVEQAAIDQLSLRYRVSVYNRFRTNRIEYDRRMAEWRRLIADWKASTAKSAKGNLVIDWLTRSLNRLQYDEVARLPELPDFEESLTPSVPPSVPTGTPSGPATPHMATQRRATVPPVTAPLNNLEVPSPAPVRPDQMIDPARIAHRVAKPPIPEIVAPARSLSQYVPPVVAPPDALPGGAPSPDTPPVMIDLEELGIRVRGYNLALKELTATLNVDTLRTFEQLQQAFGQFEDLAARRGQIVLYRNLLSNEERQQVGNPLSLDTVIALLGGKIFAARARLTDQAIAGAGSDQLDQLDRLSRKLAQLAAQREP